MIGCANLGGKTFKKKLTMLWRSKNCKGQTSLKKISGPINLTKKFVLTVLKKIIRFFSFGRQERAASNGGNNELEMFLILSDRVNVY